MVWVVYTYPVSIRHARECSQEKAAEFQGPTAVNFSPPPNCSAVRLSPTQTQVVFSPRAVVLPPPRLETAVFSPPYCKN
jgi:hypothetical protein